MEEQSLPDQHSSPIIKIIFTAGVQTPFLSQVCKESRTRKISLKFLPVDAGYVMIALMTFFGSIINTDLTVKGMPLESLFVAS